VTRQQKSNKKKEDNVERRKNNYHELFKGFRVRVYGVGFRV